jgi:hypothetical protein
MAETKPLDVSVATGDWQKMISQGKVSEISSFFGLSNPEKPRIVNVGQSQFEAIAESLEAKTARKNLMDEASNGTRSPYYVRREPWIFATFEDITNYGGINFFNATADQITTINASKALGEKSIVWSTNPKSVQWSISQRGSEAKNKSGSVLHVYRDSYRNSDYDDPKLTFQFQTGSILPTVDDVSNPDKLWKDRTADQLKIAPGLSDFYKFLQLVDQPKLTAKGEANVIHILYRSRIFPAITLTGFFDPQVTVQFLDDSSNPNTVNSWSANFTVYSMTPQLNANSFATLLNAFNANGF